MDQLQQDLSAAKARLASMDSRLSKAKSTLGRLTKQVGGVREDVQGLLGTFTSIERHLVGLFEWKNQVEARLDALEKRPPAA